MILTEEQLYEVALSITPGIGGVLTKQLINHCGSAGNVFKEKKGKLMRIPGIGPSLADQIGKKESIKHAEVVIRKAMVTGTKILFYTASEFPSRLKTILDAPALLYYKGSANLNASKVISIVGTRNATPYGLKIIEETIRDLRKYENLVIVSGLAYGIDIHAHKFSIAFDIPTIGVMASGADIIYPALHKEIALKMVNKGGLLTEYPLGSKPDPSRFPARNRIIAGMCDAVLVVEAAQRGGALITAEIANSYNKEIFSVPGNLDNKFSQGTNQLIRDHKANIFTSVKDMEYLLGWNDTPLLNCPKPTYGLHPNIECQQIISFLEKRDSNHHLDELSFQLQIPLSRLASLLLQLEFEGIVKSLPGKQYQLAKSIPAF